MSIEDRLLSPTEASAFMGVPEGTLASWRHRRQGPPFVRVGARTPRYSASALRAWLESRTLQAVSS